MHISRFSLLTLLSPSIAMNLYATSYGGTVTTLYLSKKDGNYALKSGPVNKDCGASPSWLTRNEDSGLIYCINENNSGGPGGVATLKPNEAGELAKVDNHDTLGGPVSGVVYNAGKAYAVAH